MDTEAKQFDFLTREEAVIGAEGVARLSRSCVAVFGLGGVGGACCEALVRAGVGRILLIDNDSVALSNLNRQIIATRENLGRRKTEVTAERLRSVNPACEIVPIDCFFTEETRDRIPWDQADFLCDCIDTVSSKVLLARISQEQGIPLISSMGTGNKTDPTAFRIADISKTAYCPLARTMRELLKKEGIRKLTVVFSEEPPVKTGSRTPGSVSFVPPVAGYIMAGYVINRLRMTPDAEAKTEKESGLIAEAKTEEASRQP